jgi:NAD(P)-dependent dehydrogenase (short-subunit alcohol dehydrogenase family)
VLRAVGSEAPSITKVGPAGIRINTVSPGPVATDLWLGRDGVAATISRAGGGSEQDIADSAVAATATRRFTQRSEVADLVLFLASDRSGNVTGTNVTIDGGLIATL